METNIEPKETKQILLFSDDPCGDWLSRESYSECTGVPEDEIEDDSYYDWCSCCMQTYWEDFKAAVEKHLDDTMCYVDGRLGLWNGNPEICPEIFDSVLDAIEKCIDIRGDHFEEFYLNEDGTLDIHVHHHDGCNCLTIHKIAQESEGLALCIKDWGEDDEAKWKDIKCEPFKQEEFEY